MQSSNLNLKYKFENFVVGANNKLAYVAAKAVAESPGIKYNPLYIYGGPGLGKTHLMQAIGHYIIKNKPSLKVKFVQAEEFVNDVVNALARGYDTIDKMNKFRNKYRKVDVLLIDDIQLIAGKPARKRRFSTHSTLFTAQESKSSSPPTELRKKSRQFQTGWSAGLNGGLWRTFRCLM